MLFKAFAHTHRLQLLYQSPIVQAEWVISLPEITLPIPSTLSHQVDQITHEVAITFPGVRVVDQALLPFYPFLVCLAKSHARRLASKAQPIFTSMPGLMIYFGFARSAAKANAP